jgi:hypothetical protein
MNARTLGAMKRHSTRFLAVSFLIAALGAGCTGQKTTGAIRGSLTFNQVFSWLPPDTEAVLVANGPFWMSNFGVAQDGSANRRVSSDDLAKRFEGMTLALFTGNSGVLEKHLEREKVLFAMEASRHFRAPKGLGVAPYEGCALAVFKDDLRGRRDAFMKDSARAALRVDEIDGNRVVVFKEQLEEDTWTTFVTFPQPGVVLVATNEHFLKQVLSRMRDANAPAGRALPDTLPEWKYVQRDAKFWGLRHYERHQAENDPTSPFGGRKPANIPDEAAIGLTYECNPAVAERATLTYLSGSKVDLKKIEESRFPAASEPEATAGLHIQYEQLRPGVMRTTYELDHTKPVDWFFLVLMANMGHAVYL